MTEIRVTIETREAKYTSKIDEFDGSKDRTEFVVELVRGTLHRIMAPNDLSLDKLDTPVGFVDAELSETEFRFLQQFRAAAAPVGGEIDESQYDVTVSVLPRGMMTVPLVQNDGSGANVIGAVPVSDDSELRQFNGQQFPGTVVEGGIPFGEYDRERDN